MPIPGPVPIDEVIGTAGLMFLLAAFTLNAVGRLDEEGTRYNALNGFGAGLLIYYSYTLNSMPFLVLETVWAGVAVYKLAR